LQSTLRVKPSLVYCLSAAVAFRSEWPLLVSVKGSVHVKRMKNLPLQIQSPSLCIQTGKLLEGNEVESNRHFVCFLNFLLICTDKQGIVQFVLMGIILPNLY
jgi:hypothetical protein